MEGADDVWDDAAIEAEIMRELASLDDDDGAAAAASPREKEPEPAPEEAAVGGGGALDALKSYMALRESQYDTIQVRPTRDCK